MFTSNRAKQEYLHLPLWHRQLTLGELIITLSLKHKENIMKDQECLSMYEPDELLPGRPSLTRQRLIVGALALSFVVSLATWWLNWMIPGNAAAWFPSWLIEVIENHRIETLLAPLVCLLACYWELRSMTGDIMACPERYLDERQKMLRDQAHGSAYKLLKRVCLLLPVGLLLYNMYWYVPTPAHFPSVQTVPSPLSWTTVQIKQGDNSNFSLSSSSSGYWQIAPSVKSREASSPGPGGADVLFKIQVSNNPIHQEETAPFQWLDSPVSTGTFFGTLLLSLFLMITALPMAILAWKERE